MAGGVKGGRNTELSLERDELKRYLITQLEHFFPDDLSTSYANNRPTGGDIDAAFAMALDRLEYCFRYINMPAYSDDRQTYFSHLHGDQYSQFLYYFANSLWDISQNRPICDKVMQLNRLLSGCFWSYHAGLPDIFILVHAVGSVIGNAKYGNYFACSQNCTIATQNDLNNQFGEWLLMGAGSSLLNRDLKIGDRVAIGAGTQIYSESVLEDDTLAIMSEGKLVLKKRDAQAQLNYMSFFREKRIC